MKSLWQKFLAWLEDDEAELEELNDHLDLIREQRAGLNALELRINAQIDLIRRRGQLRTAAKS